ncbi:MAG: hypothetical protein H9W81_12565 [Enterococcus sp.]|nr:hypothetical protein [Enterococcus sp.]
MGSFGVSCGISSLAIEEGEEAGLALISPSPFYLPNGFKFMLSDYHAQYKMYLPPIYGTYDGYGRLQDIKRSCTVDLLEKLFGQKIDVVMECLAQTDNFYYKSSPIYFHYHQHPTSLGAKLFDRFVTYGMTEVKDDESEAVYTFKQATLALDKASQMWTVARTDFQGNERTLGETSNFGESVDDILEFFSVKTGMYPGFAEKDYWALNRMRKIKGMYFKPEVFTKIAPTVMKDHLRSRWSDNAKTGWDESKKEYLQKKDKFFILSSNDDFDHTLNRNYAELYEFVDPLFEAYQEDESDLLEGYNLQLVLTAVNRPLSPTLLGSQYGEDSISRKLVEIMLEVLDERKRKSDEEDY